MADRTKFLNLNKPNAGDPNWGGSINANMDILDASARGTITKNKST